MNDNLTRILNNLKIYEDRHKLLELERKELEQFINKTIDVDDFKDLTYLESKDISNKLHYKLSTDNKMKLEEFIFKKKQQEYPLINDVHYYPIVNKLEHLTKEQRIYIDKSLLKAYENYESFNLYVEDEEVIDMLLENGILEKVFVFKCGCCDDEDCYPVYVTQEQYDKFMKYHIDTTLDEEYYDDNFKDGYFEIGCWNGDGYEVCSLEDFNRHLNCIRYKVVIKPDTSLDDL